MESIADGKIEKKGDGAFLSHFYIIYNLIQIGSVPKFLNFYQKERHMQDLKVIYEDNHIIVVEKKPNIPSQADKTERYRYAIYS